jgi:NADPH:quinone reductase-like Zn-dependent oxidoreductase
MGARYQAKAKGGPFEIVQVPKPTPEPDEVLIKLKVALCPLDWK